MIKENQKLLNRLNVLSDAIIGFISVAAAFYIVFNLLDFDRNFPLVDYLKLAVVFVPVQLITFASLGLYDSFRTKKFSTEITKLAKAFIADGILVFTLLYIVKIFNFSRFALLVFLLLDFIVISLKRFILRKSLRAFRENGLNRKYVLIVGNDNAARDYIKAITSDPSLGLECAGYIGEKNALDAPWVGGYTDVLSALEKHCYDEVVCALDGNEVDHLADVVEACELTGTKISVIPAIYKYMSVSSSIDVVGNMPLMNIRRVPLDNIGNAFLKRTVDIIGSLVLIILTSPIMLVSALVIKLTMGGKVIFKQQRVGLNKKNFTMYKLRSMRDSSTSDTAWSTNNDPRKTPFGSFIRKFSIDELPQLFNVLKGDMSLVGPRPEIPYYVNTFKDKIPMYMIKHQVKPGITGLAQVHGYRGDTSIEKRIEYDIEYIENWTFFLDVSILLRTLFSFVNKEKITNSKPKKKKFDPEKFSMTNKQKTDMTSLAIFFPSVVALAIVPILMHATLVASTLRDTFRLFGGTEIDGTYYNPDTFSQCKAFAIVLIAIIMIAMALVCCGFMFRRSEKRSLVLVGFSAVYVVMTLLSSLFSDYSDIAFGGVYDRAEGFFTIACYFVIFLFTMYAFRTTQNFKYVIYALFICVGVNALMGLLQFTGNNPVTWDWFSTLIVDRKYSDYLQLSNDINYGSMYGMLYHYNYVGSFVGLVIPLFTVMLIFDGKTSHRILFAIFDVLAVFMLMGSSARSGFVAIAAALIVGIIVFARIIIKHWKRSLAVVCAAAVIVVGANFAMGGRLLDRIPSVFSDAVSLFTPANDTDLFSALPVREILHNDDGSLSFKAQTDTLTLTYQPITGGYSFTDAEGNAVPVAYDEKGVVKINDSRFNGISLQILSSEEGMDYKDVIFFWFNDDDTSILTFKLFNENQIHMIDANTGERITPVNAESFGFKGKEKLGSSRGYIWSRTMPMLKNCLLIGYGPDTFAYEFPQNDFLAKYYSYDEGFNIVVDKPHNLYLQIFFSSGLIALIAFLAICGYYIVDSLRLYALKKEYRAEQIFGISVMLGIIGYLAAGLFNDSVVSVAPVFWILLGVGCALNTINRRIDRNLPVGDEEEDESAVPVPVFSEKEATMEKRAEDAAVAFAQSIRNSIDVVENTPKKPEEPVTREKVEDLLARVQKLTTYTDEAPVQEQNNPENTDNTDNKQ